MKFLEKDLEEVIFNASKEALENRGLWSIYNKRKRQLKIGNYGIADIVCFHKETSWIRTKDSCFVEMHDIFINVVELKQETISVSAFMQAIRYLKGIKRYIEQRGVFSDCQVEYNITLVGKQIDFSSDLIYIPDLVNASDLDINFFTYNFDLEKGLTFKSHYEYALKDEGFKFPRQ